MYKFIIQKKSFSRVSIKHFVVITLFRFVGKCLQNRDPINRGFHRQTNYTSNRQID